MRWCIAHIYGLGASFCVVFGSVFLCQGVILFCSVGDFDLLGDVDFSTAGFGDVLVLSFPVVDNYPFLVACLSKCNGKGASRRPEGSMVLGETHRI